MEILIAKKQVDLRMTKTAGTQLHSLNVSNKKAGAKTVYEYY